jgi:hypothetical protein
MKQQLKAHEKTHERELGSSLVRMHQLNCQRTDIPVPTHHMILNLHSVNGHYSDLISRPPIHPYALMKNVPVEFSRMPND